MWRRTTSVGLLTRTETRAPLTELTRLDFLWATMVAVTSALLFATTITSRPGLGDAPETVGGVSSLGVLHAPWIPAYVPATHAFTLLVPFGSEALRVNLFSLVCASLVTGGVQLLARRCGAARGAAVIAALTLAAGASFWFYVDFAKHDMFSGLLFLLALHLALAVLRRPSVGRLVWLGTVLGFGLGSSWPLIALLLPTVAVVLFRARAQVRWRALAYATVAGVLALVLIYGFVMVRAGQNPAYNWGDAIDVSKLNALVSRNDFIPHGHASAANGATGGGSRLAALVDSFASYGFIFGRELGIVSLILAAFGALALCALAVEWLRPF